MTGSKIEWCDHTFNPWIGCTKVSTECKNCYAWAMMDTRYGRVEWGAGKPRVRTSPDNWKEPLRWQKMAAAGFFVEVRRDGAFIGRGDVRKLAKDVIQPGDRVVPARPRVFCASLADWLDDEVSIEWLADLLGLIQRTPNLDWLLLTKRPENFWRRVQPVYAQLRDINSELAAWFIDWLGGRPPKNVWIGTSVGTQRAADTRIPPLLKIPARVRFLSCEPLLGPVDFSNVTRRADCVAQLGKPALDGIDWVICGGESGSEARPTHVKWVRSLRDQCAAVGVPFFFKQWGEYVDLENMDPAAREFLTGSEGPGLVPLYWEGRDGVVSKEATYRVGKRAAGRTLDGIIHGAFPEVANTTVRRAEDGSDTPR